VLKDYEMMIDFGGDVGGVLFDMREEISKLTLDAKKFGTAIPAQFEPLVNELIRSGNLIDENGNAITDLAGIKFGDPIVSEFEKITNKLQELIDRLVGPLQTSFDRSGDAAERFARDAEGAIWRIPKDVDINIKYRTFTEGEPPPEGAPPPPTDGIASGVGASSAFASSAFGQNNVASATGASTAPVARVTGADAGGGVHFNFYANDTGTLRAYVQREFWPVLKDVLRRDEGQALSDLRNLVLLGRGVG
jgi:hypothetical protein